MPERAEYAFLRAEVHTGITTAKIAASAKHDGKKQRNRQIARKAYDTALHFLKKSEITESEAAELKTELEELRDALRQLGEDV